MTAKFYLIEHDFPRDGRWYLGNVSDGTGQEIDTSVFCRGLPIAIGPPVQLPLAGRGGLVTIDGPLRIAVDRAGSALDFTLIAVGPPVVRFEVFELMASVAGADMQGFAARVEGHDEGYHIVNAVSRVACIDRERSEVDWWPESPHRPDRKGKARAIFKLVIDPGRADGRHFFRLAEAGDLIVSDVLKGLLEKAAVSGVRFFPV